MAVIQKTLFAKNLDRYSVLVNDVDPNSRYFKITELPDTFTGGKNAFLVAGSDLLVADTKILIEIKSADGSIIYNEPGEGLIKSSLNGETYYAEYYEGVSKVIAVYIYPDTNFGECTITILGEVNKYEDGNGMLTPVPLNWEGKYNVKWQKKINVNPGLANTTKIRFYQRPQASITEILQPIYQIVSGSKIASAVTQSFANIQLSNLETFAGDVKRVKVFRTSNGDISDYSLIQDILVESKELLTTYNLSGSVVGTTGIFTSEVLKNFWNSSSLHTAFDSTYVNDGLQLTGSGKLTYTSSLSLIGSNTYELQLDSFYSGSTSNNLGIYLSYPTQSTLAQPYTQTTTIAILGGSSPTKNFGRQTFPFTIPFDYPTASLYLSQSSGQNQWHIGNISLKLSQDTAFSPDAISFVTTMPTLINDETFNFKFEFYDVNNNYVPVAVTQSAKFTGGNIGGTNKLLTFNTDRSAFRFSTGSYGNPANQTVKFSTQKTNLTASVTYASSAFDIGGNYITPASYAGTYPGTLTNVSDNGALLTIANFSGSVASVLVGSIVYTASCESFTEYETIYRFEDGDNAPGVFVTANTNQFIYKATDLSLNPTGQVITIEAKRKNLASATTALTVNSGSGKPPLTFVSTNSTNGVDTYTIAGTTYPYTTGETTYYVSGSDQFGNVFSDAIKISPVKILDGFSVAVSNENTSFPADSIGTIVGGLYASSGSITVKVGNETINYSSTFVTNSFSASISAYSGLTPNTFNGTSYSINALSADSGSLTLLVKYKDGGGTIISSSKDVTYSKVKKAAPVLAITSTPRNQTLTAKSTGVQLDPFVDISVVVKQTYNGSSSNLTLTSLTATSTDISNIATSAASGLVRLVTDPVLGLRTLPNGVDASTITITAVVTDSEGVSRTLTDTVSLSKTRRGVPNIVISATPQAQTVLATAAGVQSGILSNVTISALEGTTSRFDSMTGTYSGFSTNPTISGNILTMASAVITTANKEASVTLTVQHTDSEGTTVATQTIIVRATKVPTGATGDPGNNGNDGKRTATGMIHYQPSTGTKPATPSATSYTFSTNAFATLTTDWAFGAPTYASGNSNKYWYSTYTAVETTAGGGTAVPSFSEPVQAIGFTGLVTFTSANNLTNGTLTSEIIPKASITNHIGGANVTTIDGGKISTGVITSTGYTLLGADTVSSGSYMGAGTIFNLDNGSLRSKNFYISSAGDASFRGTISAGAGDIGGWSINNTSISKGNISFNSATQEIKVDGVYPIIIGPKSVYDGLTSSDANSLYLGVNGLQATGAWTVGADAPLSRVRIIGREQFAQLAAVNYKHYENGFPPITAEAYPGSSGQAIKIQNGGIYAINASATNPLTLQAYDGGGNGGYAGVFNVNLKVYGAGDFTGDVTANTSDERLKTKIKNIDSPLEKISKINGVYFNWNAQAEKLADKDTEKREVGLIAQEVQMVLPEIVKLAPFDMENVKGGSKSGENYITIQYEKVVPLLVECIKELKSQIEELKRNR